MPPRRILVVDTIGDAALAIAAELARDGDEVVGADFDRLPFGLRSRHLARRHRLPDPSHPEAGDALVDLVRRERPYALLPVGTRATRLTARNADVLARETALVVATPEAFAATYDHAACRDACAALGIGVPSAFDQDSARAFLSSPAGSPTLVVKPRYDVGAARGVHYVRDAAALDAALASCRAAYGEAIVHEFIPGDPTAMRAALVVFDARGALSAAFTIRKIRQWPSSGGVTVVADSTCDRELAELAQPFFEHWRWRGAAEIEAKVDERDGRLKVIEINGRLPGYARFASICGLPLGRLLLEQARSGGGAQPYPAYAVGRRYVNPGLFARAVVADWRERRSVSGALSLAREDARGGGAQLAQMIGDPAPMLGRTLRDLFGRGAR